MQEAPSMHNNPFSGRASRRRSRFLFPLALLGLSGVVLFSTSCAKLESRDQLNKGIDSFKRQAYADAVKHFDKAVNLNPKYQEARLYLATSYMVQWVPGANSAGNNKNFDMAERTFKEVLQNDPSSSLALQSLAFMAYNKAQTGTMEEKQAALENARDWNNKRIEVNPKDAEAYYYLGVIDFKEVYPPLQTARVDENIPSAGAGPIKNPKVKKALSDMYLAQIDKGIATLKKALSLDTENEDTMTYINLLLRQKALLEDTEQEAKADVSKAEQWFEKGVKTKQMKAARAKAAAAKNS
ncbi:MAG: hypothetical protein ACRD34_00580 [Bryobacteraceae bacterium]